jgi:amidase
VRLPGVDPVLDAAVDALLATSELEVVDVVLPGWEAAVQAGWTVMFHEVGRTDGHLDRRRLGADVRERIEEGLAVPVADYEAALAHRAVWRAELAAAFDRTPVLAWPTVLALPPRLDEPLVGTRITNIPVNLAGHPSLAMPVPRPGERFPASVQLLGADHAEDLLCATGLVLEAAAGSQR